MSFSYKNKNFYLDSLPGLGNLEQDVQAKIVAQMEAKIKRIWEGAYFDPDALCEMKESVPYSLNIDEFWHHSVPFVNKIFVVVLTSLNTGDINLVYAVNCCLNSSPETKRFLTKADEVTDAIVLVMQQVPPCRHKNIVALVSDRDRMNVRALKDAAYILGHSLPPVVFDSTHLVSQLNMEKEPFESVSVEGILATPFKRATFTSQLNEIEMLCNASNYNTLQLLWEFLTSSEKVLKKVFGLDASITSFTVQHLSNHKLEAYGRSAISQMPFVEKELCAEAGVVFFLVYEKSNQTP